MSQASAVALPPFTYTSASPGPYQSLPQPPGPAQQGQPVSALGDQIHYESASNAALTAPYSTTQFLPPSEDGSSMLAQTTPGSGTTRTILFVTLGANLLILALILASGGIEFSPRLAQPPSERPGKSEYKIAQQNAMVDAAKSIVEKEIAGLGTLPVAITGSLEASARQTEREIAAWFTKTGAAGKIGIDAVAYQAKPQVAKDDLQEKLIAAAFDAGTRGYDVLPSLDREVRRQAFDVARHSNPADVSRALARRARSSNFPLPHLEEQKKLGAFYHERLRNTAHSFLAGPR